MSFFAELRRRSVFKVAVAYAIVAWLLIQVAAIVLPTFDAPRWVLQTITFIIVLGFPLALVFAWAFELTPEGVKRTGPTDRPGGNDGKASTAAAPAAIPVLDNKKQSIAVLPFVDMSPDKDQEYFSDGIAEEMLNQLSKISDLHVAGRTSSFYFKDKNEDLRVIGEKLNVAHILEGSVRKAGNRIRITAQLIKVADGYHLWSDNYDRDLDDIFAIQDEIAHAVTNALSITLGVGEGNLGVGGTRNFAAYDAYLAGLALYNKMGRENALRAIEKLEKAVALDPAFALAWGLLSEVYFNAATAYVPERELEYSKKSEQAAARIIELAPEAVDSLIANCRLRVQRREWTEADALFAKVFELSLTPDYRTNIAYGHFLQDVGRIREATGYLQQAVRLEPLASLTHTYLGMAYESTGNFEGAIKEFRLARELTDDPAMADIAILVVALEAGDRALVDECAALVVAFNLIPNIDGKESRDLNQVMHSLLDTPKAARAELDRFLVDPAYKNAWAHHAIAVWASYFSEYELALEIDREVYASSQMPVYILWRHIHKGMRRLPGFKDLVRDVGLVDYWRTTGKWGDFCRPLGDDDFECE
jgi:TolB-like protein